MNLLDLVVVLTIVSAAIGGWRLGFLARAASWLGLALGLILAARFMPAVVDAFPEHDASTRLLAAIGVLVAGAFLGQALGLLIGARFHRALPVGGLRLVDRGLGGVSGAIGVLVALWLMLPAMADVRGWPARQARGSAIAEVVDAVAPDPPDTLQALERIVGDDRFVQVFEDPFRRAPDPGPPPAASGLPEEVLARVAASTVKVTGEACRRTQEGSGFAAGRDIVVTNAHVVAGEGETRVVRPDGRELRAAVVVFDPRRDLAVLAVPGLGQTPLQVGDAEVGETGAVFGHPGGQSDVRPAPAGISQEIEAIGRDIYGTETTRRRVFVLASQLHPGDSGAALIDRAGVVVGVAFAIAPDRPDTAYALTTDELRPVLAAPRPNRVDTGPCLSE